MTRLEMDMLIKRAYHHVMLEGGATLVDMNEMSNWGVRPSAEVISSAPLAEFGDNWTVVPVETLDCFPSLAQADARSMRYYLPAFMVSLLTHYEPHTERLGGTLMSLCPHNDAPSDYQISRYALLDDNQRMACALYLRYLPELVNLDESDSKMVARALHLYWGHYLPK